MRLLQVALLLTLGGCSPAADRPGRPPARAINPARVTPGNARPRFCTLAGLTVRGDFDGDQRPDTLYQSVFSSLTKTSIISGPDPLQTDRDSVVTWFASQQAEVLLTLNKPAHDTLRLGFGQGLYCLLNLGDTNADGRDEVALVVDYCDFSQYNSCHIYSFCRGQWIVLKEFSIHEAAFDSTSPTRPAFKQITGFLEKRRKRWQYTAYDPATEDSGQHWQPLSLAKCR